MTQLSYSDIANQTIKEFLQSVVLIDDHWPNTQTAASLEIDIADQVDTELPSIGPQEQEQDLMTGQGEDKPVSASITDPNYLVEIGDEIIKEGLLFTGFTYVDESKETAYKLALKSDILILDWFLGGGDSRPALALLAKLKETGSPRFIFILTDQNLDSVKKTIIESMGEATGEEDFVFNCGPFSFSLKNKAQEGGQHSVVASRVLPEAIDGIYSRFGGLLQLAALELLGRYRNCLHDVLDYFDSDTDFPFILEWLERDSPIKDSHSFNTLAIEEWTAKVLTRFPPSDSTALTDSTISASLSNWHQTTNLQGDANNKLLSLLKEESIKFPTDATKATNLMKSLDDWLSSSPLNWPDELAGASKGATWGEKAKKKIAMNYLAVRKGKDSVAESLVNLDALFQCQASLPTRIKQGTVFQTASGKFLICITPACDCERPVNRINNCFMFLQAEKLETSEIKNHFESSVVAIRTVENDYLLLGVLPKPTFTYMLPDSSITKRLKAYSTCCVTSFFHLTPIAQLRPTRVQALISQTAGNAIEVGLDRSELLRSYCKGNR